MKLQCTNFNLLSYGFIKDSSFRKPLVNKVKPLFICLVKLLVSYCVCSLCLCLGNMSVLESDVALKALQRKYDLAKHLMSRAENRAALENLMIDINLEFDALMVKCVALSGSDPLPGTNATKFEVEQAKHEFDARACDWLSKIDSNAIVDSNPPLQVPNDPYAVELDSLSGCSAKTSSSTGSRSSLRRKEGHVKLKLARFASELQKEKCQQAEIDAKVLREAKRRAEIAESELERTKELIERENAIRESQRKIRMATEEARAWDEVSKSEGQVDVGADAFSTVPSKRNVFPMTSLPSQSATYTQDFVRSTNAPLRLKNEDSRSHFPEIRSRNIADDHKINIDVYIVDRPPQVILPNLDHCTSLKSDQGQRSNQWRYSLVDQQQQTSLQEPRGSIWVSNHTPLNWKREAREQFPQYQGSQNPIVGPSNQMARAPVVASVQDYPPPRPQIECFDGDPLTYWTFVRSFDEHIARKMPSESAKLVYLLQHCSPNIRQNLEHLSRNLNDGYRLARESLHNEFGQPHIIAYCCEQRLLDMPRLEVKNPSALKSFGVMLDKCLMLLYEIQEFATLNSLGTLERLLEKLPGELRTEWVKYSYRYQKHTGRHAKFPEFVNFVREEAEEANSLYGRSVYKMNKASSSQSSVSRRNVVFGAAIAPEQSRDDGGIKCPLCSRSHHLSKCAKFKGMGRYKRVAFLMRTRRCFKCLEEGHLLQECSSSLKCEVEGCSDRRHHTLLHKSVESKSDKSREEAADGAVCGATSFESSTGRPFFMTVPIIARNGNKEVRTYALLDSGSQRTFCAKKLARELGVKGMKTSVPICTLTSDSQFVDTASELVTFEIRGIDLEFEVFVKLRNILTIEKIPLQATPAPTIDQIGHLKHLRGISSTNLPDKTVGLLIGLDAHYLFRPLDARFGPAGSPDVIKTPLGWVLFGPSLDRSKTKQDTDGSPCMNVVVLENVENPLDLDLAPHEYAVPCGLPNSSSREDRKGLEIMRQSLKVVDGHFQLPLLWRHENTRLPDNRFMVHKRLDSLKRRLKRDAELQAAYTAVMQDYIKRGFAERVEEKNAKPGHFWFLPHHPVIHSNKPNKLRIVFDCAAKHLGVSLNEALMQGPDLLNSLVGALTRFRIGLIAVVSDIEKRFHQVRVDPVDRSFLQFLWWPNGNLSRDPETFRMAVHLFGATSSPSCAFFCLKQSANLFDGSCSEATKNAIDKAFYVDDCLFSVDSVEEGAVMVEEMRHVLSSCGFHLTKWLSNKEEVLHSVPEEDRSSTQSS